MLVTYFTHISRTIAISVLLLFLITNLSAQPTVSYSCSCDDSYPEGVIEFRITVFGNAPGELYTVDNVINLYSSINPTIVISNGTQLQADPMNTSQYVLSGFAFDNIMPFVTIRDEMGNVTDVNMITCMIPEGEITGDDATCIGVAAELEFDVSTMNIQSGSTQWNAPGSVSAVPSGPDNLRLSVSYDMPGTYLVSVVTRSMSNCEISDDIIISVTDAADGIEISGPDYLCIDNATNVMYSASNPGMYPLAWTGSGAGMVTFSPFLGSPMTGSGTNVSADFSSSGNYILSISNPDVNGCTIDGVEYMVQVVDVIDTVQIIGESYVCLDNIESYTIANAGSYSGMSWSIAPMAGVSMTPPGGMSPSVQLEFSQTGSYQLSVSGQAPDGCSFNSVLDITVPDDNIASLACNNSVNVSLNNSCILELQADMILEGMINDNDAYEIIIEDYATGEILIGNMVNQDQLGQVFKVTVIEKCGGNSCWGNLVVEDKSVTPLDPFCSTAPVITTCYDFGSDPENPIGFPNFDPGTTWVYDSSTGKFLVSGFDNCSDALLSFEDEVLSDDICDDPQLIRRTWTAVDINNGEFTTCDVVIQVALTDKNSIEWPKDFDSTLDSDPIGGMDTDGICPSLDACNQSPNPNLLCGDFWYPDANGNPSPDCTGAPVSNGFSCPNLQLIGYTDKVINVCGNSKKILRQWTVWDACDLTDIMHTQIITLMDTIPPVCEAPEHTQIKTDIHECGADIEVVPPIVSGECAGYSYTIKYLIPNGGYGVPYYTNENVVYNASKDRYIIRDVSFDHQDSIYIQYTVRDACGNKSNTCIGAFELVDKEQPIPACDFNNVVTLNQFGEAWVGPGTFDDGSWDNCGIYTRVIQRMDNVCECAEPRFDFLHALGKYNGHYYYLSKDKMHAGKAFGIAKALGAYVVRIDSSAENSWVRSRVNDLKVKDYYIGLSGVSVSNLDWQEGDSSYSNWDASEPSLSVPLKSNERVYTAVNKDGEWYAEGRNQLDLYYVLEIEDPCNWSQKIAFCCEDVGEETMVALRLIDWHGNHNQCMVNVRVLDFIPPTISCPPDATADCEPGFDTSDLSAFGSASAIDDCEVVGISESISVDTFSCSNFRIRRIFTARDAAGNQDQCTQFISIQNDKIFSFEDIDWPDDVLLENSACDLEDIGTSLSGVPEWEEEDFPCSNIAYTYDDLIFSIAEGVCQKLVRTWTVIDWCQPEEIWEYSQVIKLINTIPPQFTSQTCSTMEFDDGQVLGSCLVRIEGLTGELQDLEFNCAENAIWRYSIDLYNDGIIDIQGNGKNADGDYPYGTHKIIWRVTDDCKNTNTCEKIFRIIDRGAPTPYCHGEIVIPISHPDGVEIWASDLNLGSTDDCPGNPVFFSFQENQLVQNMRFDCSDLDSASVSTSIELQLWVWDNVNSSLANKSVCNVILTLQDNVGACSEESNNDIADVSGMVHTESLQMVYDVMMHIESPAMDEEQMALEGLFAFRDLSMYQDYKIEAFKNDNFLNGVSTLDILMIQRHILGIESLDSPYKIIAADVDNSQSISAIDLIELRKLILGIYNELPANYSWRFVEEKYKFVDPLHPFPFSENIQLEDLDHAIFDADFIAVKIGDVNSSAKTKIHENTVDQRALDQNYVVDIRSNVTEKSNTRLQFLATKEIQLAGMQFELQIDMDKSALIAAIPMSIPLANENIAWDQAHEGTLKLSWNTTDAHIVKPGECLFELLFRGTDSDLLSSSSNAILKPELYAVGEDDMIREYRLDFRSEESRVFDFEVLQNVPNPFKDLTRIEFTLDRAGPVQFNVTDQTGRLVYTETQYLEAGPNQFVLNREQLNTTGLLYYQISTGTHTATRKMMLIQ